MTINPKRLYICNQKIIPCPMCCVVLIRPSKTSKSVRADEIYWELILLGLCCKTQWYVRKMGHHYVGYVPKYGLYS